MEIRIIDDLQPKAKALGKCLEICPALAISEMLDMMTKSFLPKN